MSFKPVPEEVCKLLGLSKQQADLLYVTDQSEAFEKVSSRKPSRAGTPAPDPEGGDVVVYRPNGCGNTVWLPTYAEALLNTPKPTGPSLVQIHYRSEFPEPDVAWCRGVVLDMTTKRIVVISSPWAQQQEHEALPENFKDARITEAKEGFLIRATKRDGKVYFGTHRRLNCERSQWGNSKTFMEMFKEGAAEKKLSLDEIFGSEPSSRFCHVFFVVHTHMQMTSSFSVKPEVLYINSFDISCEVKLDGTTPKFPHVVCEHLEKFRAPSLSFEQANEALKNGIPLIVCNPAGTPIKVVPRVYAEKVELRGNSPNLKQRWYELRDKGEEDKLVAILPPERHEELKAFRAEMNAEIEAHVSGNVFPKEGTLVSHLLCGYIEWIKLRNAAGKNRDSKSEGQIAFKDYESRLSRDVRKVFYDMNQCYRDNLHVQKWKLNKKNKCYASWIRSCLLDQAGGVLYSLVKESLKARKKAQKLRERSVAVATQ